LARLGHWLKGAGGTVGFDAFTDPALQLENAAKAEARHQAGRWIREIVKLAATHPETGLQDWENDSDFQLLLGLDEQDGNAEQRDQAPLVSRLADNVRMHPFIQQFVEQLTTEVDKLSAAWEARDYQQIESSARWLKGSAGTLGFDEFTVPAEKLEAHARSGSEAELDRVYQVVIDLAARVQGPVDEVVAPQQAGATG